MGKIMPMLSRFCCWLANRDEEKAEILKRILSIYRTDADNEDCSFKELLELLEEVYSTVLKDFVQFLLSGDYIFHVYDPDVFVYIFKNGLLTKKAYKNYLVKKLNSPEELLRLPYLMPRQVFSIKDIERVISNIWKDCSNKEFWKIYIHQVIVGISARHRLSKKTEKRLLQKFGVRIDAVE